TWWLLFVPLILVVQVVFTAGVALLLAMGNLFYRDVKYLFEVIITVWMFLSSVLYPVQLLTGRVGTLMLLNPVTPMIDAYRRAILYSESPFTPAFGYATITALVMLAGAWTAFHRAEFKFAENI